MDKTESVIAQPCVPTSTGQEQAPSRSETIDEILTLDDSQLQLVGGGEETPVW